MSNKVDKLDSPARERKPLTKKQTLVIEYLEKALGVVSSACKSAGISRQTHYNWLENPEYAEAVEDVQNYALDFVEQAMFKQIKAGEGQMIRYYLSRKGKQRGYIDSKDITTGGNPIKGPEKVVYTIVVDDDTNEDNE